jgi:hypothetical protein
MDANALPVPASAPTPPASETIRKALRAVKDPELNLNIIDIGLVYDVEVGETGDVVVRMTRTISSCLPERGSPARWNRVHGTSPHISWRCKPYRRAPERRQRRRYADAPYS